MGNNLHSGNQQNIRSTAREAAKSLIRPYARSQQCRWTLKQLQSHMTYSGANFHASIGRSYFAEGEQTHGERQLTNIDLLTLPLTKIGVYRIGNIQCEEVFDLAEIYHEVMREETLQTIS